MLSQIYVLVMFFQTVLAGIGVLSCASDEDCIEGYSCHEEVCTKCMSCSLILRQGSDCIVDFNECGDCLEGFEEISMTDLSNALKPCKPVRLKDKLLMNKCSSDKTCPPDNYCHKQSCVKCFNCNIVNRLSPVEKCAKELSECGNCVKGYEEVAVTVDTNFKHCEEQSVTAKPKTPSMYNTAFASILITSCALLMLFATVCLNLYCKHQSVHILAKSQCPKLPSAPPLFVMDLPEQIVKLEEGKPEVALTVEQWQQAKVFQQPNAPYYYKEEEVRDRDSSHSPEEGSDEQDANPQQWSSSNSNAGGRRATCSPRVFVHSYQELSLNSSLTEATEEEGENEDGNEDETPVILIADNREDATVSQDENSNEYLPETSYSQQ